MTRSEAAKIIEPQQVMARSSQFPNGTIWGMFGDRLEPVYLIAVKNMDERHPTAVYPVDSDPYYHSWLELEDEAADDWELYEVKQVTQPKRGK